MSVSGIIMDAPNVFQILRQDPQFSVDRYHVLKNIEIVLVLYLVGPKGNERVKDLMKVEV